MAAWSSDCVRWRGSFIPGYFGYRGFLFPHDELRLILTCLERRAMIMVLMVGPLCQLSPLHRRTHPTAHLLLFSLWGGRRHLPRNFVLASRLLCHLAERRWSFPQNIPIDTFTALLQWMCVVSSVAKRWFLVWRSSVGEISQGRLDKLLYASER